MTKHLYQIISYFNYHHPNKILNNFICLIRFIVNFHSIESLIWELILTNLFNNETKLFQFILHKYQRKSNVKDLNIIIINLSHFFIIL